MSVVGNLSRHSNLAELTVPRAFPSYQSVATRQAEARSNLGLGAGAVTPGTAPISGALVTDANRGIAGFRDTRTTPVFTQGAATVLNATGTLTAAMMLSGIVTSTSAAAVVATLDTGTLLDTGFLALYPQAQASDYFEFSVVNTGPNSFTIATAGGWTDGGNAFVAVATATSARFGARRTAANTWTLFKIA